MRYLKFILIICMYSCSENSEKNGFDYFSNIHLTLDTVTIDSGDELIYLGENILGADISRDMKYLFNFNWNDHSIEKINLDELRLEEKLPFEKEGPNGTGQFMGRIKLHSKNQFTIGDMNRTELFSLDGEKLMTIRYESFSLGWDDGEQVISSPVLDKEVNRLYVLTNRMEDNNYTFGILNLENFEVSRMPLKSFEKLDKYKFTLRIGNGSVSIDPDVRVEKFGTKVILSNQITSAFMVFDTSIDSLYFKSYNSQITANGKASIYKTEHETEESLGMEYAKFLQDINFLPPFWDEKNQVFYRFSYQELESQNKNGEDVKIKVYLTVFDNNLNWLGETLVTQMTKIPANAFFRKFPKHFAKDGNIWIFENINDNMGFLVLSLSNNAT